MGCVAGTIWSEEWSGEIHSWTMRFRARGGHRIGKWFKRDRYGALNPGSRRFGGRALRKRPVAGVYGQRDWDYPLSQWTTFTPVQVEPSPTPYPTP
jgi:hypothetical protein